MERSSDGRDAPRYDFRADPVLCEALAYWEAVRGPRAMPQRRDVDPMSLRRILPHIQITEVVDGGSRFRYRLVGTAIVEAFGTGFTGKFVDELVTGERSAFVHACYRAVCDAKRPAFVRSKYVATKDLDLTANRVLLPLSEDGNGVHQVLGAVSFELARPNTGGIGHHTQIDPRSSYFDILQ